MSYQPTEPTIENLRALLAELKEQMKTPAPPVIRAEQEQGLWWAEGVLVWLTLTDEEIASAERDRLIARYTQTPLFLRYPDAFRYVHVEGNKVIVDAAVPTEPRELRRAVDSLSRFWRDVIVGRRKPGRPRKSQPS